MDICNFLIRATSSEWGSRNWVVGSATFAHYILAYYVIMCRAIRVQ